jgi:Flp pilus assembly protein TadG
MITEGVSSPRSRPMGPPRRIKGGQRFGGRLRSERGTAVVEFALIAPLLFLLIFGVIDFGRALDYYNQLTQLAGQGARAAAVNRNPDGSALSNSNLFSIQQQLATTYTKQPEMRNSSHYFVCITQKATNPGDPVTVKASYKFNFLPLVGAAVQAVGGSLTLTATETQRSEVAPVDTNGNPTYAIGNQNGQTGTANGC